MRTSTSDKIANGCLEAGLAMICMSSSLLQPRITPSLSPQNALIASALSYICGTVFRKLITLPFCTERSKPLSLDCILLRTGGMFYLGSVATWVVMNRTNRPINFTTVLCIDTIAFIVCVFATGFFKCTFRYCIGDEYSSYKHNEITADSSSDEDEDEDENSTDIPAASVGTTNPDDSLGKYYQTLAWGIVHPNFFKPADSE